MGIASRRSEVVQQFITLSACPEGLCHAPQECGSLAYPLVHAELVVCLPVHVSQQIASGSWLLHEHVERPCW